MAVKPSLVLIDWVRAVHVVAMARLFLNRNHMDVLTGPSGRRRN
jgi:hypothetical protein